MLGPFYINFEHVERGVAAARHERAERRRRVPRGELREPAAVARFLEPEADLLEAEFRVRAARQRRDRRVEGVDLARRVL